jgi:hypothetical protein
MSVSTETPRPTVRIPSITADAVRASVSAHTVHLELAQSSPDGTFVPVAHVALPSTVAEDLAALLARSVERCNQLRAGGETPDVDPIP